MKIKQLYIVLFLVICGQVAVNAQETLTNLQTNPKVKELFAKQSKAKASKAELTVELPFIDDFARSTGYPDDSLWLDNYAFINLNYPYNPPGIGVATLDAINETGSLHTNASSAPFSADTLTSKTINLNYPGNTSIFLSFYYQPGGYGDTPDTRDTLLLEFYSKDSTRWYKMWHVVFNEKDSLLNEEYTYNGSSKIIKGDTITKLKHKFQQVILPVDEDQYLKDTFQFRFRNYATLSANTDLESRKGNSDQWNVDFVRLDTNRTINDTIIQDIAISENTPSLLKNYQSIPWSHFIRAQAHEMADSISTTFTNLSNTKPGYNLEYAVEDLTGPNGTYIFTGGTTYELQPFETRRYSRFIDYVFPYNPSLDSALFEVRSYLTSAILTGFTPYYWNDTSRFYQKFYNYYAFDDGTAENGYGIIGEGTERAMVAMQFNTYMEDTIRGLQMYLNQSFDNASEIPFKIHIWNDNSGKPGDIIYTMIVSKPEYEDKLNQFSFYAFDEILTVKDKFYIGWQKIDTPEMLNVGFDANTVNNDKLYYNFAGQWIQSQYEGTLMIRPMLGHEIPMGIKDKPKSVSLDFDIYPNPASNYLNIKTNNETNNYFRVSVFDIYGKLYIDNTNTETTVNTSGLNPGIYFIRITDNSGNSSTKKFIVIR
ncbi:MAG: T9SS type A sorting domain-containing protein [Bacteroidales bacterium]|nr:T9SS type A sorting domain-containing protein [Bacteroidales bacterium]